MGAALQYAIANPILNAYMTGKQQRMQAEQLQFQQQQDLDRAQTQKDQFASQQDLMKQQLAAYKQHADAELAHQQAQLDEEHKRNLFQATQQARAAVNSGELQLPPGAQAQPAQPVAAPMQSQMAQILARPQGPQAVSGPQVANPQAVPQPTQPAQNPVMNYGGYDIDTTGFAKPEDLIARQSKIADLEAEAEGKKEKAKAEAQLPSQLTLHDALAKEAQALEDKRAANELARTNATNQNNILLERMRAAASRDVAKINTFGGMTPDDFTKLSTGVADGDIAKPSGKLGTLVGLHVLQADQRPVDPKTIQQLNGIHALDTLRNTMQDYIDQHAPDSRLSAAENAARAMAPGDLKNFNDIVRGQASVAAKQLGQANRMSEPEIQRIVSSLPTPASGNTRQELLQKLAAFDDQYKSKTAKEILGGVPDEQKKRILVKNGFNADGSALGKGQQGSSNAPPDIHATVNFNGRAVPKYHTDTDGELLVLDPQRGGYVSIPKQ
jgi:hypothetical protein